MFEPVAGGDALNLKRQASELVIHWCALLPPENILALCISTLSRQYLAADLSREQNTNRLPSLALIISSLPSPTHLSMLLRFLLSGHESLCMPGGPCFKIGFTKVSRCEPHQNSDVTVLCLLSPGTEALFSRGGLVLCVPDRWLLPAYSRCPPFSLH